MFPQATPIRLRTDEKIRGSGYMICKQCNEEFVEDAPFISPHTGMECFNWVEKYGFCKPGCYVTWMMSNKQWKRTSPVGTLSSRPRSRGVLGKFLDVFKR